MQVVAFNGSPREGGNTEQLIETVLAVLRDRGIGCERIDIARQPLRGCTGCCGCLKRERCVLPDGFNDWFERAAAADAVIIGSPTYFANVTAETKALLDRLGFVGRVTGALRRKPLAAVVAMRRGGALPALDAINHMGQINEMLLVGSTYWNFARGLKPGEVLDDEEGMATMRTLGENLGWLLEKLQD